MVKKNKNKVRTCGNCAHFIKIKPNDGLYKYYRCVHEIKRYSTYIRPSIQTDCKYHKFRNDSYNETKLTEIETYIIDNFYGKEEVDNKLLTFLEQKENE